MRTPSIRSSQGLRGPRKPLQPLDPGKIVAGTFDLLKGSGEGWIPVPLPPANQCGVRLGSPRSAKMGRKSRLSSTRFCLQTPSSPISKWKSTTISGRVRGQFRLAETIGGDWFDHDCRPTSAVGFGRRQQDFEYLLTVWRSFSVRRSRERNQKDALLPHAVSRAPSMATAPPCRQQR
jgi:hypothetical protein